jgi:hypothetical protein
MEFKQSDDVDDQARVRETLAEELIKWIKFNPPN